MIFHYLRRSLSRNLTRSILVSVGIIISITLISGINIASNTMAQYMVVNELDNVMVDYQIQSNSDDIDQVLEILDGLEEEIDEYEASFATSSGNFHDTIIKPQGGSINFNPYNNLIGGVQNFYNSTNICGISKNIFDIPSLENRFEDIIALNGTFNFSRDGIYLDSKTAKKFSLEVGHNITIGRFYQQGKWNSETQIYSITNYTAQVIDIPIIGIFAIPNRDLFGQLFKNSWGGQLRIGENDIVSLGALTYIKDEIGMPLNDQILEKVEADENEYYADMGFSVYYGLLIDHSQLAQMNSNAINNRVNVIQKRIELAGGTTFYSVQSNLKNAVSLIIIAITVFQTIFILISLPVLLLGWYLCKTNWLLSYQQRRRELALLKVKGGYKNQLKGMFYLEAIVVGLFGSLLGILGGNISSSLILRQVFPEVMVNVTFGEIFNQIITGRFISTSTWILGLVVGVLMSILAVRKPLKDFANMAPIDGLQKYHESTQSQIPKKKKDIILLLLGVVPIAFAILVNQFSGSSSMFNMHPLIAIFIPIITALLPLAPFALIYSSVKLLCRNIKIFEKMISKVSRIFNKTISVFTSKSIIRNQARSFRLVFIVAMALSFVVMASTIEKTEMVFQEQMQTLESADGLRIDINWSPKIEAEGNQPVLDYLWNRTEELNFNAINWYFELNDAGLLGESNSYMYEYGNIDDGGTNYGPISVGVISAENFSQYINLQDKWFTDFTAEEAMNSILQPNTTLIPETMIEQGYEVDDLIPTEYKLANGSTGQINLKVVGVYSVLPFVSSGYSYKQYMIIDNSTVQDGCLSSISLSFYPDEGEISDMDNEKIEDVIKEYDTTCYVYSPYSSSSITGDNIATIEKSLIKFLNLESYYLLIIVTFGIGIIMFISINEKSRDMGLLRARGVDKTVLYKIQLAEGTTLILIGSMFTFLGIIGASALLLQLNNLFSGFGVSLERKIVVPWLKILGQLVGSMIIFIFSILIAVGIETKKSDVSNISDLLRVT